LYEYYYPFTIFLTENEKLFSVGFNCDGELGIGDKNFYKTIQKIEYFNDKHIIDIQSGAHHSLAINSFGYIYFWGSLESKFKDILTPIKIYEI
jgi:alpha-tubulin suppressor-like RCC1 family protein